MEEQFNARVEEAAQWKSQAAAAEDRFVCCFMLLSHADSDPMRYHTGEEVLLLLGVPMAESAVSQDYGVSRSWLGNANHHTWQLYDIEPSVSCATAGQLQENPPKSTCKLQGGRLGLGSSFPFALVAKG